MDIVYINDLRIDTVIGVFDWEREIRQTVVLDLEMGWDISKAAASDDLQYTLDYKAVSDRLTEFVSASEFQLLEAMAEQISGIVLEEFSVPWLKLKLGKPGAVPTAKDVGVVIERGSKS